MKKRYLEEIGIFKEELPEKCRSALEKLISTCVMDPLLEIPNRLYIDIFGVREIKLGERLGVPVSILFIDVDNLKGINDNYGHLAGDLYLKNTVHTLKKCLRQSDLIIRWGGDEFVVLLYNADENKAKLAKERISEIVNNTWFLIKGEKIKCSISAGYACVKKSIYDAIAEADMRMYEEKRRKKHGK